MSEDTLTLAGDFPPATDAEWRALVDRVLKGADFERTLVSRTADGIAIQPLYTRADWPADGDPSGFPGLPPFTRGATAAGHAAAGWDVRQAHAHPDPAETNAAILEDLERGATSILLRLDAAARAGLDPDNPAATDLAGVDGVMLHTLDDLDLALDGVLLDLAPVALDAGAQALPAAALLMALWRRRGTADDAALGAFNADPLGVLAAQGRLPVAPEVALAQAATLAAHAARTYPGVTALAVDAGAYHRAGAGAAVQLGCAMATAVSYLRAMDAAGLDVEAACRQIVFGFAVDADFFATIAKLRAARRLWARVAEACGAPEPARAARIHARTADAMLTRRDPWVNMLRATVAAFGAGVGGADAITVQPHTTALGLPDGLARRIARNTQLILIEESGLARVIDPAGGAWALERLTDDVAAAGWTRFQEIEAAGGMAEALTSGRVAATIAPQHAALEDAVARRTRPITGVSEFPDIGADPPALPEPDLPALRRAAADRVAAARAAGTGRIDLPGPLAELTSPPADAAPVTVADLAARLADADGGVQIEPLPALRWAAPFEALRDAGDAHLARTGARPRVFLANIGPPAAFTGRATFAKNLFEAGGIEAVAGDGGTDPAAIATAFRESGAGIAALCSSDALYEAHAGDVARALATAGARRVYLAGRGSDALAAAGIDGFVHAGCDALATLRAAQESLGVSPP